MFSLKLTSRGCVVVLSVLTAGGSSVEELVVEACLLRKLLPTPSFQRCVHSLLSHVMSHRVVCVTGPPLSGEWADGMHTRKSVRTLYIVYLFIPSLWMPCQRHQTSDACQRQANSLMTVERNIAVAFLGVLEVHAKASVHTETVWAVFRPPQDLPWLPIIGLYTNHLLHSWPTYCTILHSKSITMFKRMMILA